MKQPAKSLLLVADVSISEVIGGAERVLYEQAVGMAEKGYPVFILTRQVDGQKPGRYQISGVEEWRYSFNSNHAGSILSNCKKLFEEIYTRERFSVVNFHQPISAYGVMRSPKSRNVEKIYTCHSLAHQEYLTRNPKPKALTGKLIYSINVQARRLLEKSVLRRSDKVLVLSEYTRRKLKRVHGLDSEKIIILPGGVDLDKFHATDNREKIRSRLNIPQDKIVLFTVRNLVPRMGLQNLIEAFAEVNSRFPESNLIIGGTGPLERELKHKAERTGKGDHIHFTGFISEADLPDYYRMADVFVLPTLALEGFGLVTLEALASGTPVLGTPVGGTKEILVKFNPDFLFKNTSSSAMAELIIAACRRIQDNPVGWDETRRQARRFVEENYSWKRNVDSLEKLILEVSG